jgi:hypothetical protein
MDQDRDHQARLGGCSRTGYPSAAYFTHSIVECDTAIIIMSQLPTKYLRIKISRLIDIECGDLDITYFAVSKCWFFLIIHLGLFQANKGNSDENYLIKLGIGIGPNREGLI